MRDRPDGSVLGGRGFEDRAVGGWSNPTGIELEVRHDNDDVVADVVLRRAFEGAPGSCARWASSPPLSTT